MFWILVILLSASAEAQTSQLDGKAVLAVEYSPAQQPLASQDLNLVQQLSVGSPYSAKSVAQTIDRMFATGAYADIQVDVEVQLNGLRVKFLTKSVPFVGHVSLDGKVLDPPNRSNLINAAELRLGTPFTADALQTAEKNITQLFRSNGLYEAEVHLETEEDAQTQLVHITINVSPGKRARYEMPTIQGETKLPDSTIIRATGWRILLIHRWRRVTQALTDSATVNIQKKYQRQDRLAASVELKDLDYSPETRRVKPTLVINGGPKVEVKALEAKISKGRLRRYVPVYEEGATDNDLLVEGARNLRDYFQTNGYPDVEVTFRVTPMVNDHETIDFVIAKGPRKKIARVIIQGNKYFTTETIRERIFLQASSFRLRHGRYSESFRRIDEEDITKLYEANGFRDAKVNSSVTDDYHGKEGQIAVTYQIAEGAQWLVAKRDTEGFVPEILGQLSESEGQPYSSLSVEADRNLTLTYFQAHGFPKAAFQWSMTPAEAPHQVNLHYQVVPGRQEFVREVKILGLTRTHPRLVEKHMDVHAGDPLSLVAVDQEKRKLDDLGVFAKVDAAVEDADGDLTHKYVLYDIDEASRYTMRLGIGAEIAQIGGTTSNLSQPAGGTGFSPRFLLSLSRINFLGLGHTATINGRVSNLEQRAGVSYLIPNFLNSSRRTLTFSGLYDKSSDVRTFSSKREEASVQLSQKVSKPTMLFFRFAYRRVSTSNVAIPDLLIPQLVQPVRIGIASVNLVQDRRDNPADSHQGVYNSIDVGVASSIFGSQRNFARALGRNATYYRLPGHMVLARQLTVGIIQPFRVPPNLSAADDVPLPERFFDGGNVSHRGFGENQAGPRDIGSAVGPDGIATQPTGFPLGGNALFFHSTELRFPLLGENIDGVFFHDMGNIFSNLSSVSLRFTQKNDQDFNYTVHAAGFGIRYRTPLGPVRADVAYSINPPRFVGFKGTADQLLNCNPSKPLDQLPGYCKGVPQGLSHIQFFFSIGQTF